MRRAAPAELLARAHEHEVTTSPVAAGRQGPQIEFDFLLPRGFVDAHGNVHREGAMRLATARDELLPLLDARVQQHAAFLSIVLLGRVVTRLGTLPDVDAGVIESMFATDVAFLQDLYRRINTEGHTRVLMACPHCSNEFTADMAGGRLGES